MDHARISSVNDIETMSYKEKSVELLQLTFKYSKTFENFLYKENNEKNR